MNSKNLQKLKNVLSGLVTKLENIFVFLEDIMKNQVKLMVLKKGGDQSHFGSNI